MATTVNSGARLACQRIFLTCWPSPAWWPSAHKRYTEHAARPDVAPETLKILHEMQADEKAHLTWITEKIAELEAKEGKEKVDAALRHYREIEAAVFADMQQEEQRALAQVGPDETS